MVEVTPRYCFALQNDLTNQKRHGIIVTWWAGDKCSLLCLNFLKTFTAQIVCGCHSNVSAFPHFRFDKHLAFSVRGGIGTFVTDLREDCRAC